MPTKLTEIKLNKKDYATYRLWRNFIYVVFLILFLFFSYRLIFPAKYFVYFFNHSNSLKNTLHDISQQKNFLKFYASTPQDFSNAKVEIELKKKNPNFANKKIYLQKSYRAFFYPNGAPLTNLDNISENSLVASGISVFIVGHNKKFPINNPITFQSFGYDWNSVESGTKIDLSKYQKQKLFTINSTHPDGTVFITDKNNYYYAEGNKKRKLQNIPNSDLKKLKNPIFVNEKSLTINDFCILKKKPLTEKKYYCLVSLEKFSSLIGKDYRFKINDISDNTQFEKIDLKFEKSANLKNLKLFFSDLKKKLLIRFGYEN